MREFAWKAFYRDGRTINQHQDGKELSYDNLDRDQIVGFGLFDKQTKQQVFKLHLDSGQKLIYRRRIWKHVGGGGEVCHLVGWRRNINGESVQAISYVFQSDGRIEMAGRFRESHPVFDSPVLRDFER
jgi:hypothetical protein